MEGQGFETKKAFLEYLGKDTNDRKLVDRMIHDGRACMKDGMYYLIDKDLIIEELRKRVKELEKSESKQNTASSSGLEGELEEAKVNAEYWEKECRRYGRLINGVIDVCYGKVKALLGSRFQEDKESFKEGVIEAVKEMEN